MVEQSKGGVQAAVVLDESYSYVCSVGGWFSSLYSSVFGWGGKPTDENRKGAGGDDNLGILFPVASLLFNCDYSNA